MRLHGVDAELLDADAGARAWFRISISTMRAFPIRGGLLQRRGGTARHDAVVWGYARAADQRGVDIVQNCEVTGLRIDGRTGRRAWRRRAAPSARARSAWRWPAIRRGLAAMAGLRLPIESHVLQAFVSEAMKPLIDSVVTFGAGHFYISQSDKGGLVFGGDIDGYNSYAQRGSLPVVEDVMESGMALMPMLGRLRVLRQWGGIMDMTHGWLADHRPHADRGAVSQCRLVLRRLQGDAGLAAGASPGRSRRTSRIG